MGSAGNRKLLIRSVVQAVLGSRRPSTRRQQDSDCLFPLLLLNECQGRDIAQARATTMGVMICHWPVNDPLQLDGALRSQTVSVPASRLERDRRTETRQYAYVCLDRSSHGTTVAPVSSCSVPLDGPDELLSGAVV